MGYFFQLNISIMNILIRVLCIIRGNVRVVGNVSRAVCNPEKSKCSSRETSEEEEKEE